MVGCLMIYDFAGGKHPFVSELLSNNKSSYMEKALYRLNGDPLILREV